LKEKGDLSKYIPPVIFYSPLIIGLKAVLFKSKNARKRARIINIF